MVTPNPDASTWLRRTPEGFVFASDYDREIAAERWSIGSVVRADIHKPRSGKHNRWYRALIRAVWKHQDFYKTPEALHKALKYRLGLVDVIQFHTGEATVETRSTSYDDMEEGDFKVHVERTLDLIFAEIIPGMEKKSRQVFLDEADRLLAGSLK